MIGIEQLLLRNYGSDVYGLYSPTFSAIYLDPSFLHEKSYISQLEYVQGTLTHEMAHWVQFPQKLQLMGSRLTNTRIRID